MLSLLSISILLILLLLLLLFSSIQLSPILCFTLYNNSSNTYYPTILPILTFNYNITATISGSTGSILSPTTVITIPITSTWWWWYQQCYFIPNNNNKQQRNGDRRQLQQVQHLQKDYSNSLSFPVLPVVNSISSIETTKTIPIQQQLSASLTNTITNTNTKTTSRRTVVVHIGTFKTGSTTIQKSLKRYENILQSNDNYIIPGNWTYIKNPNNNRIRKKKKKGNITNDDNWIIRINMVKLTDCFRYYDTGTLNSNNNNTKQNQHHQCSFDIINQIHDIVSNNTTPLLNNNQQNNVLLSSEFFSQSYINVSSVYEYLLVGSSSLHLKQQNPNQNQLVSVEKIDTFAFNRIIIVAYYRHYYDWLLSFWKQITKLQPYEQRITFIQFIEQQIVSVTETKREIDKYYYNGPYTYGSIKRYNTSAIHILQHIQQQEQQEQSTFITSTINTTDTISTSYIHTLHNRIDSTKDVEIIIKLYNIHTIQQNDNNDITETFFCTAIPDTVHTCTAIQQYNNDIQRTSSGSKQQNRDNVSPKITYENLLYEAIHVYQLIELQIISKTIYNDKFYVNAIIEQIQLFHTTYIQRIPYNENDFPSQYLLCLSDTYTNILYNRTIESQQLFFPSSSSVEELQKQFTTDINHKKLCSVNVQAIIATDHQWKSFFINELK